MLFRDAQASRTAFAEQSRRHTGRCFCVRKKTERGERSGGLGAGDVHGEPT
ncbi:hypothetical protein ACVWXU_000381 [Streptomyces sp. TE33382]